MTTTSTPRQRGFDVPKPDTGLAEWASKIKALQRQVDEDDEAEQRKLEAEIAASRLKRLRRSQMYSRPGTPESPSVDFPQSPAHEQAAEDAQQIMDRPTAQAAALRKLAGDPEFENKPTPRPVITPGTSNKPEPISLAAFMGARATGPRLNKHSTQPDSHDPTQFDQRTVGATPHPIFGRGGVAMPGLSSKATGGNHRSPSSKVESIPSISVNQTGSVVPDLSHSSPIRPPEEESRPIIPSIARRYIEQIDDRPIIPQQTGYASRTRSKSRERTMSTPVSASATRSITPSLSMGSPMPSRSIPPDVAKPASSPTSQVSFMEPSTTPFPSSRVFASDDSDSNIRSPQFTGRTPIHRHSTPSKVPVTPKPPLNTPSLARSVLPSPRPSPYGPQITASPVPSPAFLRAPAPKEPTPSLSRLKGRGFVQSMVAASSESRATPSIPAPLVPDKTGRPAKRSSNVLERWPAATPSPPSSPARTTGPTRRDAPTETDASVPAQRSQTPKSPQSSSAHGRSAENGRNPPAPARKKSPIETRQTDEVVEAGKGPSLGSSNTLISYIKPMKTGDEPISASPPANVPPSSATRPKTPVNTPARPKTPVSRPRTPHEEVDELGLRKRRSAGTLRVSFADTELPPSGKPLSHPTKGRAKKPRKGEKAKATTVVIEDVSETTVPLTQAAALREAMLPDKSSPLSAAFARQQQKSTTVTSAAFPLSKLAQGNPTPETVTPSPSPSRVTDRWGTDKPVIGIKPMATPSHKAQDAASLARLGAETNGLLRRALPGMAPAPAPIVAPFPEHPVLPSSSASPMSALRHERATSTPRQRVPSTGSRARVMEVAKVFAEHEAQESSPGPDTPAVSKKDETILSIVDAGVGSPTMNIPVPSSAAEVAPVVSTPSPLRCPAASPKAERRRSSYGDKFAAPILPPLREERTPAGTLSRGVNPLKIDEEIRAASDTFHSKAKVQVAEHQAAKELPTHGDEEVQLVNPEPIDSLPSADVIALIQDKSYPFSPPPNSRVVSLDVMLIAGSSANPVANIDHHVFYDMEVYTIIQRVKSNNSGLVESKIWGWTGKAARVGEKEEWKMNDLAKRYGTLLVNVKQYEEPLELVHALGGLLAVRQGSRARWSAENTAMHVVRSVNEAMFIDELDLNPTNLCSAFSYCLTILDALYVWHGRGSTPTERSAALAYARSIASNGDASISELSEGESDNDEIFWMILGSNEYAKADHWRWRATDKPEPRVWSVSIQARPLVEYLHSFPNSDVINSAVHLLDCHWEIFVLVGKHARANRRNISLALTTAKELARRTSANKPFTPSVHILVLPSQIPLDLRLVFRGLDETLLNDGDIPDHMNIFHGSTAAQHLEKKSWIRAALKDDRMLPLGVHVSMLP